MTEAWLVDCSPALPEASLELKRRGKGGTNQDGKRKGQRATNGGKRNANNPPIKLTQKLKIGNKESRVI